MDKKAYEISVNRVLSKQAELRMPTWGQAKGWIGRNADYLIGAGGAALLSALMGKNKNFWRNLLIGGVAGTGAVWGARALGLDKYWNKPKEDSNTGSDGAGSGTENPTGQGSNSGTN